jgi:hypothetical protein
MGLFKSKKEKELEKKMVVKKAISTMNKQINDLEGKKKYYIEAAKKAKKLGLQAQANLAITGLKQTMVQQKRAQQMLLNFEIASQMKDVAEMTHGFLEGLSVLSKEMTRLTKSSDFERVQAEFELAMQGVETQSEQMDMYLTESQAQFSSQATSPDSVSEAEVNSLIDDQIAQDELSDADIDAELEKLKKQIDKEAN